MRRLKKGEVVKLKNLGPTLNKEIYQLLHDLKVGDSVIVDKEDWKGKDKFGHAIHSSLSLRGRFSCRTLEDNSGWLVVRIHV